ncbi:MAG TPA: hypothetical protein VE974_04670 [Thermoanaerobaculia bacterium]|nr:hypothetical protein [Thermoanaerobaculia bacterium]
MTQFVPLFGSDFRLPERVCIVAPGPNGHGHYDAIPVDCHVIAVSKAVLIPGLRAGVWLMNHTQQDWFAEADARFDGVCVFGSRAVEEAPTLTPKKACYVYDCAGEPLHEERVHPVDGFIRMGASVSACAVQLAYNFGARELVLCGVDMSGDAYFDGTQNVHPSHGDPWPAAARLDRLLRWMRDERGIAISTVTPTRLSVPERRA